MKPNLRNLLTPSVASINVLVAYEHLCLGIQALGLCDRLADLLAPSCELQMGFWSLSALELPVLARAARHEAAHTDVLIVAVASHQLLPPPFQSWLRRWARHRHSQRGMLAARIHGILKMDREFSPAFYCLQQIAADTGVDFLWEVLEPAGENPDGSPAPIHRYPGMNSLGLDAILPSPLN